MTLTFTVWGQSSSTRAEAIPGIDITFRRTSAGSTSISGSPRLTPDPLRIVSASTVEPSLKGTFAKGVSGGNIKGAEAIGKTIAERSIEKGIKRVVFDRSGFLYHGRIRAVADAARKAGLEF